MSRRCAASPERNFANSPCGSRTARVKPSKLSPIIASMRALTGLTPLSSTSGSQSSPSRRSRVAFGEVASEQCDLADPKRKLWHRVDLVRTLQHVGDDLVGFLSWDARHHHLCRDLNSKSRKLVAAVVSRFFVVQFD